MKVRIAIVALVVAVTSALAGVAPLVFAQSNTLNTSEREAIRDNCVSIKNTLNQLKVSDALLRVNRGQIYESMGTKLMDSFNARLSFNGFENQGLVTVTNTYDAALSKFRSDYQTYARQLATAISIDCTQDPDGFYLATQNARTRRETVHDDVKRLHAIIKDYRSEVSDFQLNYDRIAGER